MKYFEQPEDDSKLSDLGTRYQEGEAASLVTIIVRLHDHHNAHT